MKIKVAIFLYTLDCLTKLLVSMKKSLLLLFLMIPVLSYSQVGYKMTIEVQPILGVGHHTAYSVSAISGHGFWFNEHIYAGAGVGIGVIGSYNYEDEGDLIFPLFARFRYNLLKSEVSPFLSMDAGYTFSTADSYSEYSDYGVRLNPAIGLVVRFGKRAMYFTAGVDMQQKRETNYYEWYNTEPNEVKFHYGVQLGVAFQF